MHASNKLTADWFRQIIGTLKSDTYRVKGHEKRTEGRVGLRCTLELVPRSIGDTPQKPIMAWVRDISVNGIGLVSTKPVEVGVELIANFSRHGMPPLSVVYKVRYSRRLSTDLHSIGASLKQVLNGELVPRKEKPKAPAPAAAAVPVDGGPVEG